MYETNMCIIFHQNLIRRRVDFTFRCLGFPLLDFLFHHEDGGDLSPRNVS
jgi:hypothetical protein